MANISVNIDGLTTGNPDAVAEMMELIGDKFDNVTPVNPEEEYEDFDFNSFDFDSLDMEETDEAVETQPDLFDDEYDVKYEDGRRMYTFNEIEKAFEKILPDWDYTGGDYYGKEFAMIYEPKSGVSLNSEKLKEIRKIVADKFGKDVVVRAGRSEYAPEQKKLFVCFLLDNEEEATDDDFKPELEDKEELLTEKSSTKQMNESENKELLKEEYVPYKNDPVGEMILNDIANDLESGNDSGYLYDANGDSIAEWNAMVNGQYVGTYVKTDSILDYVLHEISYPVADGFEYYNGLDMLFTPSSYDVDMTDNEVQEDLIRLGFNEEDVQKAVENPDEEIECWIDYQLGLDMDDVIAKYEASYEDSDAEELNEGKGSTMYNVTLVRYAADDVGIFEEEQCVSFREAKKLANQMISKVAADKDFYIAQVEKGISNWGVSADEFGSGNYKYGITNKDKETSEEMLGSDFYNYEVLEFLSESGKVSMDEIAMILYNGGYFDHIPTEEELQQYLKTRELNEDTVKQGSSWVNKGKEGTHGKFKTKKAADKQRKAMFANGYKAESVNESETEEMRLPHEESTFFDDLDFDSDSERTTDTVYLSVDVARHNGAVIVKSDEYGKMTYLPDDYETMNDTLKRAVDDYVRDNHIVDYEVLKLYESASSVESDIADLIKDGATSAETLEEQIKEVCSIIGQKLDEVDMSKVKACLGTKGNKPEEPKMETKPSKGEKKLNETNRPKFVKPDLKKLKEAKDLAENDTNAYEYIFSSLVNGNFEQYHNQLDELDNKEIRRYISWAKKQGIPYKDLHLEYMTESVNPEFMPCNKGNDFVKGGSKPCHPVRMVRTINSRGKEYQGYCPKEDEIQRNKVVAIAESYEAIVKKADKKLYPTLQKRMTSKLLDEGVSITLVRELVDKIFK